MDADTADIDVSDYITAAGDHTIDWYDETYQLRIMTTMYVELAEA